MSFCDTDEYNIIIIALGIALPIILVILHYQKSGHPGGVHAASALHVSPNRINDAVCLAALTKHSEVDIAMYGCMDGELSDSQQHSCRIFKVAHQ